MDELENKYQSLRSEMDHLEPTDDLWSDLDYALGEGADRSLRKRKRIIRFSAAAMVAFLIAVSAIVGMNQEQSTGLEQDQVFPDVVLTDMEGKRMRLSDLKGKVVLVEFWASWSTVCTEENCYYFEPIYNEYQKQGFEIYAISLDHSKEEWQHGVSRDELPWIHVSDLEGLDSELTSTYGIDRLPATFLLDHEGRIVARDVAADELRGHLDVLLASK